MKWGFFVKKGFRVGLILTMAVFVGACNIAYADTSYDVTTEAQLNSALTEVGPTTKILNINSNINLTGNVAAPSGTAFTINGNNDAIGGGAKVGLTLLPSSTLTVNNTSMNGFGAAAIRVPTGEAAISIYNSTFKSNVGGVNNS